MMSRLPGKLLPGGRQGRRDGKRAYAVLLIQLTKKPRNYIYKAIPVFQMRKHKKLYTALMNHLQVPAGSGKAGI